MLSINDIKKDDSMICVAQKILEDYRVNNKIVKKEEPKKSKKKKDELKTLFVPDGILFYDLYDKVCELKKFTKEQIEKNRSQFYTDLTLSSKFVMTGENYWDLSSCHTFKERNVEGNAGAYNDDYDEEAINEAKEKYIAMRKAEGKDLTVDMDYVLSHMDELLSDENEVELDAVDEDYMDDID